jgi:hypothetical protein
MDDEIGLKDNEKVLKQELKSINSYEYGDKKLEEILNSNPLVRSSDKREQANSRLMKTFAKTDILKRRLFFL